MRAMIGLAGLVLAAAGPPKPGLWFGDVSLDARTVAQATVDKVVPDDDALLFFTLTPSGHALMTRYTSANVGKQASITLDGRVISGMRINMPITAQSGVLMLPEAEAEKVARLFKSGGR